MPGNTISGDRELSNEALLERVQRAATGFMEMGVAENDAVGIMLRNDLAFLEAHLGLGRANAYPVPINWHFRAEEAGYILRDSKARALVIHADLLPQIVGGIPDGVQVLVVPTPPEVQRAYGLSPESCRVPGGMTDWNTWLEGFEPHTAEPEKRRFAMLYTSGTTGNPKGVRREAVDLAAFGSMLESGSIAMGLRPDIVSVMTGPLYHSAPNAWATLLFMFGATQILQPRFDPEELLQLIEKHRVSHLHMVPTMFVRLLKLPDAVKTRYDLSSLEHVVHGAAPCPVEVKHQMLDWWGPVINEYYGATESGFTVFATAEEWLARPGTVGKALPGAVVKVFSAEGAELPPGEVGEIYVKNGIMTNFTYYGKDEKRQEIEREGMVTIGDVGHMDEDGFVFLSDRKNDMVISGGVNIYPAEIEATLIGLPGVQDCAVFGIPDDEFGEALAAVIQPEHNGGLAESDVRTFLQEKLARYKMPRVITFQSELPREDSGKIFKRKLREPYWEKTGRNI